MISRKKSVVTVLFLALFLTGCHSEEVNQISQSSFDQEKETILDKIIDGVHKYEIEHNNSDSPVLNIWLEKYEQGQHKEDVLSFARMMDEEDNEPRSLIFSFNEIVHGDNDDIEFTILDTDGDGTASIEAIDTASIIGDENRISTFSQNAETINFQDGEEYVIGVLQYDNEVLEGTSSDKINHKDEEYFDTALEDVALTYILKAQFSKEYKQ